MATGTGRARQARRQAPAAQQGESQRIPRAHRNSAADAVASACGAGRSGSNAAAARRRAPKKQGRRPTNREADQRDRAPGRDTQRVGPTACPRPGAHAAGKNRPARARNEHRRPPAGVSTTHREQEAAESTAEAWRRRLAPPARDRGTRTGRVSAAGRGHAPQTQRGKEERRAQSGARQRGRQTRVGRATANTAQQRRRRRDSRTHRPRRAGVVSAARGKRHGEQARQRAASSGGRGGGPAAG